KIAPQVKQTERRNQKRKELLKNDQYISRAAQKSRHIVLVKKKGDDGESLNKIANTGHQKNIQRNDRQRFARRNKEGKSTRNEHPTQRSGTFTFGERTNQQPLIPPIRKPPP